jgi:hypothetical protein
VVSVIFGAEKIDSNKFLLTFDIILDSLDNSDWMRNGDYAPSRLESQQDAGI